MKWSGRYPEGDPRSRFDESLGYLSCLAQGADSGDVARPLTDDDFNAHALIVHTHLRRLLQWGVRDGSTDLKLFQPTVIDADNQVGLLSGQLGFSHVMEQNPFYSVGGLPAIFPGASGVALGANIVAAQAPYCFRRVGMIDGNSFVDDAAYWVPGSLVDCPVEVYDADSNTRQTGTVIANSETRIVTSFTITKPAGSYYFIRPLTPSGDDQEDTVWLDVYRDEVALAAAGGDPVFDANLSHNIEGAPLESMRRMKLTQCLIWDQGNSQLTPNLSAFTGGLYYYTDLTGNEHFLVKLMTLFRRDGVARVQENMIADRRHFVGRQANVDMAEVFASFVGNGVFDVADYDIQLDPDGTLPVDDGTLTVKEGRLLHAGERVSHDQIVLDAQTTGDAWEADTKHYVYIDSEKRLRVDTAPSGAYQLLWSFQPSDATHLGVFVDHRNFLTGVGESLSHDASGYIKQNVDIRLRRFEPSDTISLTNLRAIRFWNADDEVAAFIACGPRTPANGAFAGQATIITTKTNDDAAAMFLGAGDYPSAGPFLVLNDADDDDAAWRLVGPADRDVDAYADAYGGVGPRKWLFKETRHQGSVMPGFKFGNAQDGPDPMAPTIWVPGAEASWDGWSGVDSVHTRQEYDTLVVNLLLVPRSLPSHHMIRVPVLINMTATGVRAYFAHSIISADAVDLHVALYGRPNTTAFAASVPDLLPDGGGDAATVLTLNSGVSTPFHVDVTTDALGPNTDWPLLELHFWFVTNSGAMGASDVLRFLGISPLGTEWAGIGDRSKVATLSPPLFGME